MTTYQDIRRQIEDLSPNEKLLLLEDLAGMLRRSLAPPPTSKRSIMDLEGLGKEIWQGVDAREYVDRERNSWNDRFDTCCSRLTINYGTIPASFTHQP